MALSARPTGRSPFQSRCDPARAALADLKTALQQTKAVGGHTVLLVVGHGKDGTQEEVWSRSIDNIKQALPLCAELGMTIAIENVWNQFLYQHDGPQDQTADHLREVCRPI
ncbi:MAG: TIM barrel protein [Pirellulaceae bacterium]